MCISTGYIGFGNYYPDLVFLLCERQPATGGESFIVDGQRLLGAIAMAFGLPRPGDLFAARSADSVAMPSR